MAEIRQVDNQGNVVEPVAQSTEAREVPITSGGDADELLYPVVHSVMGLENDSEKMEYREKVKILIEFAKYQTDDHSPENIAWILRDFDMRLGSGPFAEKRINYVANYARLKMDRKHLDQEIAKIESKSL